MSHHPRSIAYKVFLRILRPELADRILGQGIARTEVLRRQSGESRQHAEDQARDELLVQYGTRVECAAALRQLPKRSPLPDQFDARARVVCCPDYVLGIHDDG